MRLGYNTNGLAFHPLPDALALIAEAGYRAVALTPDHHHLDPTHRDRVLREAGRVADVLRDLDLAVTVETGARFVLDRRRKHQPTLISARRQDRDRRVAFLETCIRIASALGAEVVSLWSGAPDDDAGQDVWFERLVGGLRRVLDIADANDVRLAFEPEPGMFVDTMARFTRLIETVDHPGLGLTLDVGHVHCLGDGSIEQHVRRWASRLWNVHLADMRRGVHDHLMFGEGEIDFEPVFASLHEAGYAGPANVELSRHSHDAVRVLRQSYAYLARFVS